MALPSTDPGIMTGLSVKSAGPHAKLDRTQNFTCENTASFTLTGFIGMSINKAAEGGARFVDRTPNARVTGQERLDCAVHAGNRERYDTALQLIRVLKWNRETRTKPGSPGRTS